jgi:hypothetical protein
VLIENQEDRAPHKPRTAGATVVGTQREVF